MADLLITVHHLSLKFNLKLTLIIIVRTNWFCYLIKRNLKINSAKNVVRLEIERPPTHIFYILKSSNTSNNPNLIRKTLLFISIIYGCCKIWKMQLKVI